MMMCTSLSAKASTAVEACFKVARLNRSSETSAVALNLPSPAPTAAA